MRRWLPGSLGLVCLLAIPAQAGQVCAWLVETNQPDDVRELALWLQSDTRLDFLLKIGGKGISTESMTSNSPSTATFVLDPGEPAKAWGYGATLDPPGTIEITAELHVMPADIFSDAPTPLLAGFRFQRDIPAGETKPPATLAKKQCATTL